MCRCMCPCLAAAAPPSPGAPRAASSGRLTSPAAQSQVYKKKISRNRGGGGQHHQHAGSTGEKYRIRVLRRRETGAFDHAGVLSILSRTRQYARADTKKRSPRGGVSRVGSSKNPKASCYLPAKTINASSPWVTTPRPSPQSTAICGFADVKCAEALCTCTLPKTI